MNITTPKDEQERLFDELIAVKILLKALEKKWKHMPVNNPGKEEIQNDLTTLKARIGIIESNIAKFGESFLDVYDAELIKPLSESDILLLRDEISEVRDTLEAMAD